jgi:hypothetical protein
VLDVALGEVIEHLVARDLAGARDTERLLELLLVEVADPPIADLAARAQLFERSDRVLERLAAGPVQEVAVEVVGTQAPQALLAGVHGTLSAGMARHDLARDEQLFAAQTSRRDGLRHELFDPTRAVELGRVEVRHSELDPGTQRCDCGASVVAFHLPGALADHGNER